MLVDHLLFLQPLESGGAFSFSWLRPVSPGKPQTSHAGFLSCMACFDYWEHLNTCTQVHPENPHPSLISLLIPVPLTFPGWAVRTLWISLERDTMPMQEGHIASFHRSFIQVSGNPLPLFFEERGGSLFKKSFSKISFSSLTFYILIWMRDSRSV